MPHPRRFRFAVSAHVAPDGRGWRTLLADAERYGYTGVLVPDHFTDQFAPVPAISYAAAASSLRVGVLVACNDFRHPVAHAKELATLDVLSGGRVEWGIGAGWLPSDYQGSGIPFDPPGTRVARLEEAVTVMKALFAGDPVHHDGAAYRVDGLVGSPAPVQRPHPPLLIGAAGRRMLRLAGREADVVGVAPSLLARSLGGRPARMTPPEATDLQLSWIAEGAAGRVADLELNMVAFPTILVADPGERASTAARVAASSGMEPGEVLAAPHAWIGTVDQICEALVERRARWGVSYWAVPAATMAAMAPVVARLAGT